jgi:toxin-antitoxin system PIN domain toxin
VILLDTSLLIYAIDSDSVRHAQARRWLEGVLSGTQWVGLPWIVLLAFVRITTRAGILRKPLPVEAAVAFIDGWMEQPYVTLVGPGDNHWAVLRNLLLAEGTAGNLTSDAHLAALAIEHGCTVASTDHDFRRFAGVTVFNPLSNEARQ